MFIWQSLCLKFYHTDLVLRFTWNCKEASFIGWYLSSIWGSPWLILPSCWKRTKGQYNLKEEMIGETNLICYKQLMDIRNVLYYRMTRFEDWILKLYLVPLYHRSVPSCAHSLCWSPDQETYFQECPCFFRKYKDESATT